MYQFMERYIHRLDFDKLEATCCAGIGGTCPQALVKSCFVLTINELAFGPVEKFKYLSYSVNPCSVFRAPCLLVIHRTTSKRLIIHVFYLSKNELRETPGLWSLSAPSSLSPSLSLFLSLHLSQTYHSIFTTTSDTLETFPSSS